MKWNESGFRPPLCKYRLNWARRTSWGWWDDWDDTVLHTQDSKFEPWRSEAEHATSRSRRLPTILTFTRGWGNNFVSFQTAETGNRTPDSGVKGSGANHYPRAPALLLEPLRSVCNTADIYAHSMPLNSLKHCKCTALMTNIRPGFEPSTSAFRAPPDRMSHRGLPDRQELSWVELISKELSMEQIKLCSRLINCEKKWNPT